MSGDKVWVHGAVERAGTPDAISGETVLGYLAQNGDYGYSVSDMFFGFIPGSVGETSAFLILLGGLFLVFSKIASWRIMVSAVLGALAMGLIFNGIVDQGWIQQGSKFYGLMSFDFWKHLIVGGTCLWHRIHGHRSGDGIPDKQGQMDLWLSYRVHFRDDTGV